MAIFILVRGIGILRSSLAASCITPPNTPVLIPDLPPRMDHTTMYYAPLDKIARACMRRDAPIRGNRQGISATVTNDTSSRSYEEGPEPIYYDGLK